ncbi:hypothetical protein [Chromobacterium vaccinii]|uniref:hypothetical protein n=1 Tax=Chromobacterium vaccinii TaxID=1108595 RepID=UPI0031D43921
MILGLYEGPKKALRWLARHDEQSRQAFEQALKPNAGSEAIEKLVLSVAGPLRVGAME